MDAALEQLGRPKSVVLFAVMSFLYVVADVVLSPEETAFGDIVESFVPVGLTLWVVLGRSRVARLIYTGLLLFVVVVGSYIWEFTLAEALLSGASALALLTPLWWPSTTAWLKPAHQRD